MRLTADTNVLLRATMNDDAVRSPLAQELLSSAELIAATIATVCEFVWVLSSYYRLSASQIGEEIRRLAAASNVKVEQRTIAAGLALLDRGGDFADGATASEGRGMGGGTFASFDRAAVKLLAGQGFAVLDPAVLR